MAIRSHDQLIAAQLGCRIQAPVNKSSVTTVAGRSQSGWLAGGTPAAGVAPGAAAIPTKATAGALVNFAALQGGGLEAVIDPSGLANMTAGTIIEIYDRVSHMSGLVGNSAVAQTVNTTLPDRGDTTNYTNLVAFLEIYTAIGATPTTITASYTNSGGTAGRTSPALTIPASLAAGNVLLLPFQTGDTSLRTVQTITFALSTGTAGNVGVTVARRLGGWTTVQAGQGPTSPISTMGVVPENACLWVVITPPSTASGILAGGVRIIEG
jgi:hypothetical protein